MTKNKITCDCSVIHEKIVNLVKDKVLNDDDSLKLSKFFKVFGDETRIKIISALEVHEMCVCDLACILDMTKSAVSHQISYLKTNNLINFRREGKVVFYSLSDDHIKTIYEMGKEHINE